MSTSGVHKEPRAVSVEFSEHAFKVGLVDGREIIVPLEWFPSLRDATTPERDHWRLIADGVGIHWPDLDEDISVAGLLG